MPVSRYFGIKFGAYTYEVNLLDIAQYRHREMRALHPQLPDEEIIQLIATEFQFDENVIRYMRQHLTWDQLRPCLRMVGWTDEVPNLMSATFTASYEESIRTPIPVDPASGRAPLDIYYSILWQEDAPMNVTIFSNSQGEPRALILMIRGSKEEIEAHLSVAAQLQQQMAEHPEGAAKPPRPHYPH